MIIQTPLLPLDSLEESDLVQHSFYHDDFACAVDLPELWSEQRGMLDSLAPIFRLVHRGQPKALIEITGRYLTREIGPPDWLRIHLEDRGESIQTEQFEYNAGGGIPDFLTLSKDRERLSRWTCRKSQHLLLTMQAMTLASDYESVSKDLAAATKSLRFKVSPCPACAEPLQPIELHGEPTCRFCIPAAWHLSSNVRGEGVYRMELSNRPSHGYEVGRIELTLWNTSLTLEQVVQGCIDDLKRSDHRFGKSPIIRVQPHKAFNEAIAVVFPLQKDGVAFEMNTVIQQRHHLVAILALRTAPRARSREWWAVNKRAFEIVLESFILA